MRADEKAIQQAYVDWVYRLLEKRILELQEGWEDPFAGSRRWRLARIEHHRAAHGDPSLVFGCFDTVDGDSWYVGRTHVDGDGRQEAALMDWRADHAQLFYQADRSDPMGVGRRLTFKMRRKRVESVAEDVLTKGFKLPEEDLDVRPAPPEVPKREPLPRPVRPAAPPPRPTVPVEELAVPEGPALRARDLVLEELDRERTGRMHEVVALIQADQDRLIRRAMERVTVVQGGPGTGKTVVGLQRAAWVLYQQRDKRLRSHTVAVVGPNRAFLDYIGDVLPQLGETAAHLSIDDLALLDLPDAERARFSKLAVADDRVDRLKGDARMAGFVAEAVWGHAAPAALSLPSGTVTLTLTATRVGRIVDGYRKAGVAYETARQRLAGDVLRALHEVAQERMARTSTRRVASFEEFARSLTPALTSSRWIDAVLPAVVPRLAIQRSLTEADAFAGAAQRHLTPSQRAALAPPAKKRRMAWTAADLPLVAEAAHVVSGDSRRFGHLIVDEAQDLSPMQWRLVARRASARSLTILGDLAQATSASAPASWEEMLATAGLGDDATVESLRIGYRVPRPIIELAARLLPEIAPGVTMPESIRPGAPPSAFKVASARALPVAVADLVAGIAAGKVGVIALEAQLTPILATLRERGLDAGRGSSDGLRHHITALDPVTSKGLEFDHVVVVEPSAIATRSAREKRRLFVALTRATKTLTLVHANLLPPALRGAIESQPLEVELPPPAKRIRRPAAAKKAKRLPAPSSAGMDVPEPAAETTHEGAEITFADVPVNAPVAEAPIQEAQPRADAVWATPPEGTSSVQEPASVRPSGEVPAVVPPAAADKPLPGPTLIVPARTRMLRKVDLRAEPSTTAPVVSRARGALTIIGQVARWVQVRTPGGAEGWVLARDVRR